MGLIPKGFLGPVVNRVGVSIRPRQTLVQAVYAAVTGRSQPLARAANHLHGLTAGDRESTRLAAARVVDDLPHRSQRDYTSDHFIAAVYEVDSENRHRTRGVDSALLRAAQIEAEIGPLY